MDIYWLEQSEADVPPREDWLSANEAGVFSAMRFPKRRADWLLGRWTAKKAFAICFGCGTEARVFRDIEIRAAPSGAPEVLFRNEPSAVTISLSHRAGMGICTVARTRVLLGCDLEIIEPHSEGFAADYFTSEEQALVAKTMMADRSRLLALLWSGKESALKALHEGLRLDTRCMAVSLPSIIGNESDNGPSSAYCQPLSVACSPGQSGWSPLQVRSLYGQILHGWWSESGNLLRTVLGVPAPVAPILLMQEHYAAR